MSLDIDFVAIRPTNVFEGNITHNLGRMAAEAGLYTYLWRPYVHVAQDLIKPLEAGLGLLKSNPKRFKAFNPENGWGDYDGLVKFVERYLEACRENPDATIEVSR